ncbi:hypothetical protein SGFS_075370 [Streptomyces graminofaciens]|uniref:Uncharacterized protein n=1 Tax=Streptomyces graminofaciens TaxID=68212 RepID=A0ABM7FJ64_9ACTN|nr:hypothetical protein SGFS_075370 [Streptomyces graminofaciens]
MELTLPETGVCGGSGLFDEPGAEGAETGSRPPRPGTVACGTSRSAGMTRGLFCACLKLPVEPAEPTLTSKNALPKEGGERGAPGRTRTCGQALRRRLARTWLLCL